MLQYQPGQASDPFPPFALSCPALPPSLSPFPLFPSSFPTSPALTALSFSRYLHVLPTSHRFAGSRPRGGGGRVRGGVSIATAPRRVRCCGDAPSQASDVITMGPGMVARVLKRSGAPRRGPGSPSAASASGSHCLGEAGAPGVGPSRVGLTLSPPFPASTSPGLTGGCPGGHAGPVFEQCLPVECCSPTTQLFCLCQGGFPRWTCLTKTSQKPEG